MRVPQKYTDRSSVAPRSRHTGALGHHSGLATLKKCLGWPNRIVLCELHVGGSLGQSSHILAMSNGNLVDMATCAHVLLHVTGRSIVVDTGHINRSLISFEIFLKRWAL